MSVAVFNHTVGRMLNSDLVCTDTPFGNDMLEFTVWAKRRFTDAELDSIRNETGFNYHGVNESNGEYFTHFKKRNINIDNIEEYPDELTTEEFDSIRWNSTKQFGLEDDRDKRKIADDVIEYAKRTGSQIYAQVDCHEGINTGQIVYAKGLLIEDAIGIWEAVILGSLKVENEV